MTLFFTLVTLVVVIPEETVLLRPSDCNPLLNTYVIHEEDVWLVFDLRYELEITNSLEDAFTSNKLITFV